MSVADVFLLYILLFLGLIVVIQVYFMLRDRANRWPPQEILMQCEKCRYSSLRKPWHRGTPCARCGGVLKPYHKQRRSEDAHH